MFDVKTSVEVASETALISLSDVKSHLYITHSDDDTYLTTLIGKARKQLEKFTSRAIGAQTKVWTVDLEAGKEYQIPFNPVNSVSSVTLKTDIGEYTAQTNETDYEIEGEFDKIFRCFESGRYKITYTCGYSTTPDDLKQAILCQIAYLYENRGDQNKQGLSEISKGLAEQFIDYSWT